MKKKFNLLSYLNTYVPNLTNEIYLSTFNEDEYFHSTIVYKY